MKRPTNLGWFLTLLLAASLFGRRSQRPWEVEATFELPPHHQKVRQLLEVENGRYRLIKVELFGNRSMEDEGVIVREGNTVSLRSDRGDDRQFPFESLRRKTMAEPRIHAKPGWFQPSQPLQVNGIGLDGTPHKGEPDNFGVDKGGRIWWIVGETLTQSGRVLLNQRSRREDVEALFGPQEWRPTWGFLATNRQATIGHLSVTVDESDTLIRLRLAR